MIETSSKKYIPNGGLVVIYYGTIRKKSPKKQIQVLRIGLKPPPSSKSTHTFP